MYLKEQLGKEHVLYSSCIFPGYRMNINHSLSMGLFISIILIDGS